MQSCSVFGPHLPQPAASLSSSLEGKSAAIDNPPRRVTQLDIARVAGVHNTTVSLALRNSAEIPSETRERIRAIAEQMGYQPDPALRALVAYRRTTAVSRRTETIAYITN